MAACKMPHACIGPAALGDVSERGPRAFEGFPRAPSRAAPRPPSGAAGPALTGRGPAISAASVALSFSSAALRQARGALEVAGVAGATRRPARFARGGRARERARRGVGHSPRGRGSCWIASGRFAALHAPLGDLANGRVVCSWCSPGILGAFVARVQRLRGGSLPRRAAGAAEHR